MSEPLPRYRLVRCEPSDDDLLRFGDHTLFQTRAWLDFVASTQRAEIVTANLLNGERSVGRFTGLVVRRYGMRILGSPLPGWTTRYQGFNLEPGTSRVAALRALESFAFAELRCLHVEVMDRHAQPEDYLAAGFHTTDKPKPGYEIDLSPDEGQVFAAMAPACRWSIRKSERVGVMIEVADGSGFADDYHAQLRDVFAKQRLVPTYDVERVRALIDHLLPTGRLLLLRARDDQGTSIATGIFPAANRTMYFWGGASWRPYQHLRPNEALIWHAMRYWRDRGMTLFDMMGGGSYKRKYGAYQIHVPHARTSRFQVLERLRAWRKGGQTAAQRLKGRLRS